MKKNNIKKIILILYLGFIFIINCCFIYNKSIYAIETSALLCVSLFICILKLNRKNKAMLELNKNLEQNQKKYNFALEKSKEVVFYLNVATNEFNINSKVKEILAINDSEKDIKLYDQWFEYIHKDDKKTLKEYIDRYYKNKVKTSFKNEYRVIDNNGMIKWINSQGKIVRDFNGEALEVYGSFCDITDKKEKENKIEYMSYFDNITGLYNRNYLKKYIKRFIETSNNKSRAALIFIDIDNFKYINDSYGHDYGDELLRVIALSFKNIINEDTDILCRFGGDEFVIFIKDFTLASRVEEIASKLINVFESPRQIKEKNIYTSASIGITFFPEDAKTYEILLRQADAAMYKAKGNGKNRYQFFNDEISRELARTYEIEKGLRDALTNNELYTQFQPKVVLEDARIMGFEALLRWNSKELGMVSPVEFIPVAENTRMIIPIGRFVIEEVFKKCKELIDLGYKDFKIALNLSEVQLRDGHIVEDFVELSNKYGVNNNYIEAEITESILMKSLDKNIETLLRLKEFGVSVALDDFGTGYSSLNYLTKLPIDVLKIDRSFIIEINGDEKSKCIVENIIQLSHKLGIKVVAEGVEIQEQVDDLKDMLCDFVQGYYYSKPQNFDNIVKLMEQKYILA